MAEPFEIAQEALEKMKAAIGDTGTFSGDQIWAYAAENVPSARRPGAITKLRRKGLIAQTGQIVNAATPSRAGSKTPEYRFSTPGTSTWVEDQAGISDILDEFVSDCSDVLALSKSSNRLLASLLAKRFVIFTGLAGSGKTKLAQAFSHWITPFSLEHDAFEPGAEIASDRITYFVHNSDTLSVEFWNSADVETATRVTLPREIIAEWARYIKQNSIPERTPAREIREAVKAASKFSDLLHSFETHLKAAAFALINKKTTVGPAKCHALIPVGADWTGNENILGYPDSLDGGSYVVKPALELILQAERHRNTPHFLILDEMNMSHVERYFADILSVIESDEGLELYPGDMSKPHTWRKASTGQPVPPRINELPKNLFIIGTVNVDETTYMFSPKVLDRANVIEFRLKDGELAEFLNNPTRPDLSALNGKGALYGTDFVKAANIVSTAPTEVKKAFNAELLLFFSILQEHGAEFGYRTAHEAGRFLHFFKFLGNHSEEDVSWFREAFDCIVLQKLLPKLHGSRSKLSPLLRKLWFLCVTEPAARGDDAHAAALKAASGSNKDAEPGVAPPSSAPYPLSAEKIGRMWRLLSENGFASFAEA